VAHQRQHATVLGGAGEIGMAKDIAGAVDPGTFAVPEAEHPVEFALPAEFRLLRAPDRSRSDVLVEAGLETNVVFIERALRADELLVKRSEKETTLLREIARVLRCERDIELHSQP